MQLRPSCYLSSRHAACVLVVLSERKAIAAGMRQPLPETSDRGENTLDSLCLCLCLRQIATCPRVDLPRWRNRATQSRHTWIRRENIAVNLRGLDLNQRPLGYEPEENRLSSSFFGTSGTLRTFQEASVSGIGGLKGVCLEQPSQWCFPPQIGPSRVRCIPEKRLSGRKLHPPLSLYSDLALIQTAKSSLDVPQGLKHPLSLRIPRFEFFNEIRVGRMALQGNGEK